MCFSMTASFSAGLVLSAIGVASLRRADTPAKKVFASIPFVFSIQQVAEGFVWLSLSNPLFKFAEFPATTIFLFIAQVVWPFYVPLSIALLEENEFRKKILQPLIPIGILISIYLGFCLMIYPVKASIVGYHISYAQNYPAKFSSAGSILYVIATVLPPFISSIKRMFYLAIAISVSYIITQIFYTDYVVSVWCFFASVISITIFIIMPEIKKKAKLAID